MINKKLKVLFYYFKNDTMSTDAANALEKIGVEVYRHLALQNSERSILFNPIEVLSSVIRFSPDYFIFLNNFGIDQNSDLLRALSILGVKSVSWFIDNPFYFYDNLKSMKNLNNFYLFVWERFYTKYLSDFGFKNIFYLPQATNPERFNKINLSKHDESIFSHDLTFAGNLDLVPFKNLIDNFFVSYPDLKESLPFILEKLSVLALTNNTIPSWEIVSSFVYHNKYSEIQNNKAIYLISKILEAKLSQLLRKEFVTTLSDFNLSIWGDLNDWGYLNQKVNLLGKVSYFNDMPKVYNGSKINLNISRVQQRSGTNQRVFDVPACMSFLISDYREELEEMFELGKELVVYRNFNELRSLVSIYQDDKKRNDIAYKGFLKVLDKHTYNNRMSELLKVLSQYKIIQEDMFNPENDQALLWIAKAFLKSDKTKEAIDCLKILIKVSKRFYRETDLILNELS